MPHKLLFIMVHGFHNSTCYPVLSRTPDPFDQSGNIGGIMDKFGDRCLFNGSVLG
jgi:hypothetical protein